MDVLDDMLNDLFEKYSIQNYIASGGAFTNGINSSGFAAMNSGGNICNVNGSGGDNVAGFGDSHSVRSFSGNSRQSHNSHASHSQPRVSKHLHRGRDPICNENFRIHDIGHGRHSLKGRHGTSDENRYFMNKYGHEHSHENRCRNGISNENGLNDMKNGNMNGNEVNRIPIVISIVIPIVIIIEILQLMEVMAKMENIVFVLAMVAINSNLSPDYAVESFTGQRRSSSANAISFL